MAEPISIQQLKDASEDAISLADFINKPENVMIPRRLAADINSLQYYLDYMSSYAQHSYETYDEMVANAPNLSDNVSVFVTNDLDLSKNGIYTYNGNNFVKGEYQPENAAKEFVEDKLGGLEVFDGKVRAQDVSTVDGSTQDVKNTEFRNELDTLPDFIDGKLSDSVVSIMRYGFERTQAEKNIESVSPLDFGATSDGTYHPVSEWTVAGSLVYFEDLAAIQAQYPHVTALTDSIDWAALQAFFNYCNANYVVRADATINGYINKPLNYHGYNHATNVMYGDLHLTTNEPLDYMLWLTGQRFQFLGSIRLAGKEADTPQGRITHRGLLLGKPHGKPHVGEMSNAYINSIECYNFLDSAVHWGNYCHFSEIGNLHTANIGSRETHVTAFTDVVRGAGTDVNQNNILKVASLPPEGLSSGYALASVDNSLYRITKIDRVASEITVYPILPSGVTAGTLKYVYGSGLFAQGSDSSNLRVRTSQHILTGIGLNIQTLFGMNIGTLTTEFCGAGLLLSNMSETSIGNLIQSSYFEENSFDIVNAAFPSDLVINILQTTNLNLSKCVALYKYRIYTDGLMEGDLVGGTIFIGGKTYSSKNSYIPEITDPSVISERVVYEGTTSIQLTYNPVIAAKFEKKHMIHVLTGAYDTKLSGDVVFLPPAGMSINGQTSFTVNKEDYVGTVFVSIKYRDAVSITATVINGKVPRTDVSSARPTGVPAGTMFIDVSLSIHGKPIWYSGTNWIDATGTIV